MKTLREIGDEVACDTKKLEGEIGWVEEKDREKTLDAIKVKNKIQKFKKCT